MYHISKLNSFTNDSDLVENMILLDIVRNVLSSFYGHWFENIYLLVSSCTVYRERCRILKVVYKMFKISEPLYNGELMAQYFYKRSWSRFRLKNLSLKRDHFWLNDPVKGSLFFGIIWTEIFGTSDSIWSSMRFREWILEMYVFACTLCASLSLKKK